MQNWASVPYIRRVIYHELIGKRLIGGNRRADDDQLLNGQLLMLSDRTGENTMFIAKVTDASAYQLPVLYHSIARAYCVIITKTVLHSTPNLYFHQQLDSWLGFAADCSHSQKHAFL